VQKVRDGVRRDQRSVWRENYERGIGIDVEGSFETIGVATSGPREAGPRHLVLTHVVALFPVRPVRADEEHFESLAHMSLSKVEQARGYGAASGAPARGKVDADPLSIEGRGVDFPAFGVLDSFGKEFEELRIFGSGPRNREKQRERNGGSRGQEPGGD